MAAGIARKLGTTYLIIILASVISGGFCVYVLNVNLRTNFEMRTVTLPSVEYLKELRAGMEQIRKLTSTWVYVANNRDRQRLEHMLAEEFPAMDSALNVMALKWTSPEEKLLYGRISASNTSIADSARKVTVLLSKPEFYANDPLTEYAASLNESVDSMVRANDREYEALINTKEQNLSRQQYRVMKLLHALYLIVLATILLVIIVSIIAFRYSSRKIVKPILDLDQAITDMATGKVAPIKAVNRADEIGQMQAAMNKMIAGIMQKIEFAEQIGKGNYEADFTLLSANDKFGTALLTMRDNLRQWNEALTIQDKRLLDAQKLARIGNYYYDIETGEVQTSSMLDDILGIEKGQRKLVFNWRDHILPQFHKAVASAAVAAMKGRHKFNESYIIRRYADGKEYWVNAIGEYNFNEAGKAVSMFGTIQDITRAKQMETELSRAYNTSLDQNNRLLNFSYIVSHNLRMHAVNIQGLLGLVKEARTQEERDVFLSYLKSASDRLDETLHHLNDVLAMQNTVTTKKTPVELRVAVLNALQTLEKQIAEKDALVVNEVPENMVVTYDAVYLDSILTNLLSNAVKYASPDRRPVITISCRAANQQADNGNLMLKIADNGLGIDLAANGDKIFGMYKTFHGNSDARGVGLFMTKYQVEAMGGNITVESIPGIGTIFKIHII